MTPRGVAVHDGDCARRGGEGFRAHDPEGIVEGHHPAATRATSGMHVIVAVRTPTFDEAVFPQLKEGHVNLVAMNQIGRPPVRFPAFRPYKSLARLQNRRNAPAFSNSPCTGVNDMK